MAANTGKLAEKVIFISGASRGIGRAIALKAAKDGAKVVIAAKTKDPHPKLEGTIYTVAEEVEKSGGKCLPCVVDIRDEDQVTSAVDQTIKAFGRLDILVNNASAISLTNTSSTTMKSYDLMNNINTRGTYLCSKMCMPHLQRSGPGSHILNISPPLNMSTKWFENHVAYTIAKYGMSMCALGMSGELKDAGIAVNTLWPKTAIYTAAMEMLGGGKEIASRCRTADIMADAAYLIFSQPASYTGKFLVDELVLRDLAGMTDFSGYKCVPGSGEELMLDFFLEPHDIGKFVQSGSHSNASVIGSTNNTTSSGQQREVEKSFEKIQKLLGEEAVKSVNSSFVFILSGSEPGTWYLDLKSGIGSAGKVTDEASISNYEVQMRMTSEDFVNMFNGKLVPTQAFMSGKLKIKGNAMHAMRLESLMAKTLPKL